ncbi:hypothetical protein CC86DRAFT_412559 [Ophiobolus disseminans]|uniref:Uncharacterized protein n=1 Tax=Ophiobolus disseminans TaxID=1469910 RepID=A0A6A6ZIM1_9PLEO|nr:hypothetical protein CC86DRAFT_412559 [Ophiobolus disseminans]
MTPTTEALKLGTKQLLFAENEALRARPGDSGSVDDKATGDLQSQIDSLKDELVRERSHQYIEQISALKVELDYERKRADDAELDQVEEPETVLDILSLTKEVFEATTKQVKILSNLMKETNSESHGVAYLTQRSQIPNAVKAITTAMEGVLATYKQLCRDNAYEDESERLRLHGFVPTLDREVEEKLAIEQQKIRALESNVSTAVGTMETFFGGE